MKLSRRWSWLTFLLGAGISGVTACSAGGVQGSGNLVSETRSVQGFDRISLSVDSYLNVNRTGSESLTVRADDNILPLLTIKVVNHTLQLGTSSALGVSGHVVFTVTARDLTGIDLAGDGHVTAVNIATPAFRTTMAGNGSVALTGQSQSQSVDIAGDGTYDGTHFPARDATVTLGGDGHAIVNASDNLRLDTAGAGSVDYLGTPRVTQSGQATTHHMGS